MVKKGFTLIELLAVILILGIIAVIAIPTVNNIIKESTRNSFKATVQNIAKAVETDCQVQRLKGEEIATTYIFSDTGVSPSINIKGSLPTSGTIKVDDECNITFKNVTDGNYKVIKTPISEELDIIDVGQKVCHATQGDGSNIGDIITCGTESFYVYDTTGDTIKMLAKYNLRVGGETDSGVDNIILYNSSEFKYNMQDENMKSFIPGQVMIRGITRFSSEEQHGVNYSSYEGSIVEDYVDRYAEILINMGINIIEARMITNEELIVLECNLKDQSCNNAPSFIRETTFWTGTALDENFIWISNSNGFWAPTIHLSAFGVRPVMVILKSEI